MLNMLMFHKLCDTNDLIQSKINSLCNSQYPIVMTRERCRLPSGASQRLMRYIGKRIRSMKLYFNINSNFHLHIIYYTQSCVNNNLFVVDQTKSLTR